MNHCKDCKYFDWVLDKYGECKLTVLGESKPWEPDHETSLAIVQSNSGEGWLKVREDFGCVQWEAVEK